MGVTKPYFLTVRQFTGGDYSEGGRWQYIRHGSYSSHADNYVRSYLLLQKDLIDLFNYVEPADTNLSTYSFRIHELFVRTCLEIEANFKAIFALNKYARAQQGKPLSVVDYHKIDSSHYLSDYLVKAPYWREHLTNAVRRPFEAWGNPSDPAKPWVLSWYQDYNTTKHDRANSLNLANFANLLDASAALVALITAQYLFVDFGPGPDYLETSGGPADGFDPAIGNYFRVRMPTHVPASKRYDFDWRVLRAEQEPFQRFDYDAV